MKKDTINIIDTIKIFKKNIRAFYIFISLGFLFGILGAIVNTNYIEAKSDLTLNVSIKNPLKNYYVLDLFTLESININENGISMKTINDKVENYYRITEDYLDLLFQTINFDDYNINNQENGYEITTEKNNLNFYLKISNVYNSEEIRKNLTNLSKDLNPLILPIILENIKKETEYMESFLNSMTYDQNSMTLEKLIMSRKNLLRTIGKMDVEIFETSVNETKRKISNSQIIILSFLLSISMFLLFIILKR